jgi:hypothetical protein
MKGDGAPARGAIAAFLCRFSAPEMSQRRSLRATICRDCSIRIVKVPRD